MCGICGELRFDNSPADMDALRRMTARLARRGPDHEGYYNEGRWHSAIAVWRSSIFRPTLISR